MNTAEYLLATGFMPILGLIAGLVVYFATRPRSKERMHPGE